MKSLSLKRIIVAVGLVVVIAAGFAGGWWLGDRSRPPLPPTPIPVDFAPFWKAWQIIDDKYVATNATTSSSSQKVSDQERVWGAIGGMVEALGDPYTSFLPPSEKKLFDQEISGNFGGVGMEIGVRDHALTVVAPLKGTPAMRSGIKAGDKIIQIDETPAGGLSETEAIGLIRGEIGTTVRIKVIRGSRSEPLDFTLVRENIDIPTIDTQLLPEGVFLIRLYNFSAPSPNLFRAALRQFVEGRDTNKLIIDLRGNPGGYLDAAVNLASWFLPAGQPVAIEDHGGNEARKVYRSYGYDIFNDKLKLVILVDGGSASASEIFAGALSEYGKAILVGEKTFGKGSVQELIPLTDDSSLKVTVARWLTPNGHSISHEGLTPDVVVKGKESDYSATLDVKTDPQLAKAVEVLLKK